MKSGMSIFTTPIGPLDGLSSDDLVLDPIENLNRYTYHGEDHWNTPYLSLLYMWFAVLWFAVLCIFRCLKHHQEVNSLSRIISLSRSDTYVKNLPGPGF